MIKQIIFLTGGLFITSSVFTQQITPAVIAPAGDISKSGKLYLQWTLGEPVIETISSRDHPLTQGFHQPYIQIKKPHAFVTNGGEQIESTIIPNPYLLQKSDAADDSQLVDCRCP